MSANHGMDLEKIEAGVRLILEGIGEDLARAGILDTPRRVAEMYAEVCGGLHEDPTGEIKVIPAETHDEIVMVKDIPIASLCEHHLLPFTGVAHIAYIPKDGRIVEAGAHRRHLLSPPAGAGTVDHSDRRTALSRRSATERRDGRDRSDSSVHDDAWSQKGRRDHDYLGGARRLQKRRAHPHRSDVVFDREQARLIADCGLR